MTSDAMWNLFYATGDPLFYLLYKELLEAETGEKSA